MFRLLICPNLLGRRDERFGRWQLQLPTSKQQRRDRVLAMVGSALCCAGNPRFQKSAPAPLRLGLQQRGCGAARGRTPQRGRDVLTQLVLRALGGCSDLSEAASIAAKELTGPVTQRQIVGPVQNDSALSMLRSLTLAPVASLAPRYFRWVREVFLRISGIVRHWVRPPPPDDSVLLPSPRVLIQCTCRQ